MVQQRLGLRPNEMLNLVKEDIALPEDGDSGRATAMFGLGIRASTKAKRPQVAILQDQQLIGLVRWILSSTGAGERLFPYAYSQYRKLLHAVVNDDLKLDLRVTPHSPRAGFASDMIADGEPIPSVMQKGRWLAESSLRCYVDIVASASIAVTMRTAGMNPSLIYAREHFVSFFEGAS
jgi:integrase